jgi:hypothetical protein
MFSDIGKGTSKMVNEEDERHSGSGLLLLSLPSPYKEWTNFLDSIGDGGIRIYLHSPYFLLKSETLIALSRTKEEEMGCSSKEKY